MTTRIEVPATDDATIEEYDLIIIGSGSGNSIPEFLDGWKIAIVERGTFGGTCLNVGCIPSKMFVLPADLIVQARHAARLDLDVEVNGADFPALRDRIFGRIDEISDGGRDYRANGSPNITLIEGTARFIADRTLHIDGVHGADGEPATTRTIRAPKILVAAGGRPSTPPIDGLVETGFHTSDTIMRLDDLPARLGIIGGGFIAAEMGHVFSALGSKVTLINRSPSLLRAEDDEIASRFTSLFAERVELVLGEVPRSIHRRDDGAIELVCDDRSIVVDELLVATGRVPNTDLLDPHLGGLTLTPHGTIAVDDTMAAIGAEGVWAIGDIANAYQLKHVANAEARVAFWNLAHPDAEPRRQSYKAVPGAVFSNPQIASVGLTEREARASGLDIAIGRRDYSGTAYGWAIVDQTSFAKIIVDRGTGLIVGAHIIGPQASTLIQPLIQAMQLDNRASDVAEQVFYIHPALTEVIENALLDALVHDEIDIAPDDCAVGDAFTG